MAQREYLTRGAAAKGVLPNGLVTIRRRRRVSAYRCSISRVRDFPENPLLMDLLQMAVPLWVDKFRDQPFEELVSQGQMNVAWLCEKGDSLFLLGKDEGDTARSFNAVAENLAILSFCPGGIDAFGLHFESREIEHG